MRTLTTINPGLQAGYGTCQSTHMLAIQSLMEVRDLIPEALAKRPEADPEAVAKALADAVATFVLTGPRDARERAPKALRAAIITGDIDKITHMTIATHALCTDPKQFISDNPATLKANRGHFKFHLYGQYIVLTPKE